MDKNLFFYELEGRGYIFQNKKWDEAKHRFEDDMLNMAWEMWASAKHSVKAQAVPESNALLSDAMDAVQKLGSGDFVLVPKEPTCEMIESGMGNFDFPLDNGRFSNHDLIFAYRAMIEAQEQSHD